MNVATIYSEAEAGGWRPADLVERYAGLVKRIAYHLSGRLPDTVQLDDLMQAGMVGLLEAAQKFDDRNTASFETFAGIRIRGAMLDEVRRHDWTPRSVHRWTREISEAMHRIEGREGRPATDEEVAEELELSLEEYHRALQDTKGHKLLSLNEAEDEDDPMIERLPSNEAGVLDGLENSDLKHCVADAIRELPEREQLVLALYYDEQLNLREIGAVLGVSESRVSQIHSQAVTRIRSQLTDWAA